MIQPNPEGEAAPAPAQESLRQKRLWPWIVGCSLPLLCLILAYLFPPKSNVTRAAARSRSSNNLKQMVLAFQNHEELYNRFPGANACKLDSKGNLSGHPVSWRVLLLPFLEEELLFSKYRFEEPWDGPNNSLFLKNMPVIYRTPKPDGPNTPEGYTHYRVFISKPGAKPATLFTDGEPGPIYRKDITDEPNNTILAVEAPEAVPWTKPEGIFIDPDETLPKLTGVRSGGYLALMVDGGVRFIRESLSQDVLRAMLTRNGAETIPND